jgi:hypothetical protein
MIRKYLFLLIACIAAAQSSVGQPLGFSLADGRSKVVIPIEIHNNLVVMPVVLNGSLPLKFILDTGVRTAILTEKAFSDILNLTYARKYTISGPGGAKMVDAYVTNNVSLQLPGVIGRGHAMLVLGEDYLELRNYLGTDVHGIIGYELFSRFIVKIDYSKKLLTLMLPERFHPGRRFEGIPIKIEDTKPYVTTPVLLNDSTQLSAKLLVDSGASHGLMLEPSTDDRIKVPKNTVSSVIGRGLGGQITGKVGRIKELDLGSFKMLQPISNFPDANSYFDSLKSGSRDRNGAIGGEVLSRFTVVFNFPKEMMYLKKNSFFKKRFHYNLSGITVKAKGSRLETFEITEVRGESVADKSGVKIGDLIKAINGIPSESLDLNIINSLLNAKPRKKIHITVERNGQWIKCDFRLTDQV